MIAKCKVCGGAFEAPQEYRVYTCRQMKCRLARVARQRDQQRRGQAGERSQPNQASSRAGEAEEIGPG